MLNTIYVLQWDNYYDRIVHPWLSTREDRGLTLYLENDTVRFQGVNFNPNDGVNTSILLNLYESQQGNYLIVVDDDNRVVSRWFIIDAIRTRGGQYQLNLHRDVITDYWNVIRQSPVLIEKCNISYDNPLIFNNEDMTFNQIKTSETLLKDITGCAWLVAYIAKDATDGLTGSITVNVSDATDGAIRELTKPINEWLAEYDDYYGDYISLKYYVNTFTGDQASYIEVNGLNAESKFIAGADSPISGYSTLKLNTYANNFPTLSRAAGSGFRVYGLEALKNIVNSYTPERHSTAEVEAFLSYNNALVQDSNGEVYRISIKEIGTNSVSHKITAGSLYSAFTECVNSSTVLDYSGNSSSVFSGTPNDKTFAVKATYNQYTVSAERQFDMEVSYTINSGPNRAKTIDAAYDIIAIPYGTIYASIAGQSSIIETNKELGLATIQAIAKNMDAGCYDIQLLPYCPVPNLIVDNNNFLVTDTLQYSLIKQGENNAGIIFNVPRANFTTNIFYSIPAAQTAIGRKINNDCDKWRLSSPNYSNYFDFNVEKNNGVQYFNVDCCYKPYTPYIHINPNFNGLYGQDFNDPRGLVCGGDFSLTQVRDAWESYQLQNKNFQATFDRQIQNMEINNKYQLGRDITNAIVGTIGGGAAGGSAGMIASGGDPTTAMITGISGGVLSAAGGIADVEINRRLRNETMDYTKDLFGYQLGNIQAIPLTLTKVSSFNLNNKVFPVLEYYTCTYTEKQALANKLAYNGMTCMVIDTIEEALANSWEYTINGKTIKSQNYIKAKPIHLKLGDDFHIANAIASEMNLGFMMPDEE